MVLVLHLMHVIAKNLLQIYEIFFYRIEINLENNKKEIKAKCKICNKLLSGGSNAGTSHLKRDHENCKTKNNVDIRNYMQLGKNESGNLKTFSYDESYCREKMIGYIIRVEQPFNFTSSLSPPRDND